MLFGFYKEHKTSEDFILRLGAGDGRRGAAKEVLGTTKEVLGTRHKVAMKL